MFDAQCIVILDISPQVEPHYLYGIYTSYRYLTKPHHPCPGLANTHCVTNF